MARCPRRAAPAEDEEQRDLAARLRRRVARQFGRSLHIRTLDTGSCAVCEQEIRLLAAPHYDLHRLGFFFTPAPRHADLLLVTGPMIRAFDVAVRKTYAAMPGPKIVVATGACALGGVYPADAFVHGSADAVLPVDVWIPGCPPQPAGPPAGPAGGRGPARGKGGRAHLHGCAARRRERRPLSCGGGERDEPAGLAGRRRRRVGAGGGRGAGRARRPGRDPGVLRALRGGRCGRAGRWGVSAAAGDSRVVTLGAGEVVGSLQLQATSLAGVFAALLGLVAVGIALYMPRYDAPGRGSGPYLAVYNLALVASAAVLAAGGVVTFLVAWESMALLSYLLILRHPRQEAVARGAFWFLALSEAGFVLIIAAFVMLATKTHAMELSVIAARAHLVTPGWRDTAYLLALTGFGFKAGLVPLHVWLPEAHPVAPADGSAFLSGLIVKLGVYGIALFGFRLLPAQPPWTGLITMAAGALTAAIGILYAMNERDIKRFLAFSTIENTGIIITAFGAALIFGAYHQPALLAFLLLAGLYHVANHGTYKTLLFLEAGVIEHATGTRDMDRLGGLIHRLPRSAVITLAGTLGIAALPPLNGFVSEWLIFQGLFQGFRTGSHLMAILIVTAAATLGLTGGLAIYAFVRGYGIPFLGMPRTRQAAEASERGQPVAGPALLAVACAALALGAPVVLLVLSGGSVPSPG